MKHLITILLFIPIIAFGQATLESANKLYKKGAYKKAQKEYADIITSNPNSYDAYIGLANCYYGLKDFDAAIKNCTKAIGLEIDNPRAYALRAPIYYLSKDYSKALLDYNKLIELNSKDDLACAYFMRGTCKLMLHEENKEDACSDFRKAKELGWNTKVPGLNKYCDTTDLE